MIINKDSEEQKRIREFVIKFFRNLGSNVAEEEIIKVSNVPENFQKFYGKKEPYYFYFDKNISGGTKNAEFITKGSFLLNAMNKFLENKGKTTLFKIEFPYQIEEKIKKLLPSRNCEIDKVFVKKDYGYLTRFTFLTIFQYINEKEQIVNNIFVKDGELYEIDLNEYKLLPGNKRHVKLKYFEKDYNKAKEKLAGLLANKKYKTGHKLNKLLSKELSRIEKHKNNQIKEAENNLKEAHKQIKSLNKKLEDLNPNKQEDKDKIKWTKDKIQRLKEEIDFIESGKEKERIESETEVAKSEETQKHALDIKNKIMNTSIIYYPIYENRILLKGPYKTRKSIDLRFNPLTEKHSEIKCESCNQPVKELILCSSGHLTCRQCGNRCESCQEVICGKCQVVECEQCSKKICKHCSVKCAICGKQKCKKHIIEDKFSGKEICQQCIKRCSNCGDFIHPDYLKTDEDSGKDVCEKCLHKAIKSKTLKDIFKK